MSWAKAAVLLLQLAYSFAKWVEAEKTRTAAEKKVIADAYEEINKSVELANRARESARTSAESGGVRAPDQFERK